MIYMNYDAYDKFDLHWLKVLVDFCEGKLQNVKTSYELFLKTKKKRNVNDLGSWCIFSSLYKHKPLFCLLIVLKVPYNIYQTNADLFRRLFFFFTSSQYFYEKSWNWKNSHKGLAHLCLNVQGSVMLTPICHNNVNSIAMYLCVNFCKKTKEYGLSCVSTNGFHVSCVPC